MKSKTAPSSENVNARILRAALREFAEKGFEAATVRSICDAAAVNGAAVNYHFQSKENLYHEVIREQFEDFGLPLVRIPDGVRDARSWRAAVRKWVRSALDLMVDERPPRVWVTRLFWHERHCPSSQLPLLLDRFYRPVNESLRRLIRMGMPAGADEQDVEIWAVSIHGQINIFGQRSGPWREILVSPAADFEKWISKMAEHIASRILSELHYQTPEAGS